MLVGHGVIVAKLDGVIVALLDSLTGTEVIVILVLALIVLGPDKLPGVARQAGRLFNQLRDLTSNLQNEMREVLDDPTMQPLKELGEFAAQPRRKLAEYARQAAMEDADEAESAAEAEAATDAAVQPDKGDTTVEGVVASSPDDSAADGAAETAPSADEHRGEP